MQFALLKELPGLFSDISVCIQFLDVVNVARVDVNASRNVECLTCLT